MPLNSSNIASTEEKEFLSAVGKKNDLMASNPDAIEIIGDLSNEGIPFSVISLLKGILKQLTFQNLLSILTSINTVLENAFFLGVDIRPISAKTYIDASGIIAAVNTSQSILHEDRDRRYLFIQNTSNEPLYFDFLNPAVLGHPSIKLNPNDNFVMEGSAIFPFAVNIIGQTAGQTFLCKVLRGNYNKNDIT